VKREGSVPIGITSEGIVKNFNHISLVYLIVIQTVMVQLWWYFFIIYVGLCT
jgi:hypothetical protein